MPQLRVSFLQDSLNINGIAVYQIVEFDPTMFSNCRLDAIMNKTDVNDVDAGAAVFRKAMEADIPAVTAILKAAVERMLAEGKRQWNHSYPNETHVRADVAGGNGYVLQRNNVIVAYGAVVFDGEPAYGNIRGEWLSGEPYVVVHRMAVLQSSQNRGCGISFLKSVEDLALSKGIRSFRVDTNHDNTRMLNLLKKTGFVYCGEISYDGESRMAFAKNL